MNKEDILDIKLNKIYSTLLDIQEHLGYIRDENEKHKLKYEKECLEEKLQSINFRKENSYKNKNDILVNFEKIGKEE